MKVTIAEPSATLRELDVEMPQDVVAVAFEEKLKKYSKQIKINGFRPGKVPRNVILARYGDSIRAEAIDSSVDKIIREELTKADIQPVTQGRLEDFKDDKENPITFKVVVEVDPKLDIEGYTDFGVKAAEVVVPKSEVDEEYNKAMTTKVAVDRASQKGDIVAGQYIELSIEGEVQDVPENPHFEVEIGASATPDFDKGLTGVKAGEEVDFDFTFPADYQAEELRDKKAHYQLKIETVSEKVISEMNDELKEKYNVDSEEAFRERIEKNILEQRKIEARRAAHGEVIEKMLAKFSFEVPEARLRQYIMRDLNKEELSDEEFAAGREEAEKEIRKYRILDAISTKENIKVKQNEVDGYVASMAAYYGIPFEDLKGNLRSSGQMVQIREELKLEKTLNFLIGEVEEETKQEG